MKIIRTAGKKIISMTKGEWEEIGETAGWITIEAKKKKTKNNPWAICTKSVGREDKAKYERCVMDVKKEKGIKK